MANVARPTDKYLHHGQTCGRRHVVPHIRRNPVGRGNTLNTKMTYTLPLGKTAHLVFQNAINESQALAQLRSAFPQLERGVLNKPGWKESPISGQMIRDESKDLYHEPEIKLVENK
jgi:hypothetical protein